MLAENSEGRKVADERRELEAARSRKVEAQKRTLMLYTEKKIERQELNWVRERHAEAN